MMVFRMFPLKTLKIWKPVCIALKHLVLNRCDLCQLAAMLHDIKIGSKDAILCKLQSH